MVPSSVLYTGAAQHGKGIVLHILCGTSSPLRSVHCSLVAVLDLCLSYVAGVLYRSSDEMLSWSKLDILTSKALV